MWLKHFNKCIKGDQLFFIFLKLGNVFPENISKCLECTCYIGNATHTCAHVHVCVRACICACACASSLKYLSVSCFMNNIIQYIVFSISSQILLADLWINNVAIIDYVFQFHFLFCNSACLTCYVHICVGPYIINIAIVVWS